jgi:putative phage-type endonuclease
MIDCTIYSSREEWLEARGYTIGGSDAAALVGLGHCTTTELWEYKTARAKARDISDLPIVQYGVNAEEHLRALFALDFPEYQLHYQPNNLFRNPRIPFAHASLDGWLTDKDGRDGILEIKTATIRNNTQYEQWHNRIPDNYYCQVCWYMGVCEADFAVLKAHIRFGDTTNFTTRHYFFERSEAQADIDYLLEKGAAFWQYILKDKRPPLVLKA